MPGSSDSGVRNLTMAGSGDIQANADGLGQGGVLLDDDLLGLLQHASDASRPRPSHGSQFPVLWPPSSCAPRTVCSPSLSPRQMVRLPFQTGSGVDLFDGAGQGFAGEVLDAFSGGSVLQQGVD